MNSWIWYIQSVQLWQKNNLISGCLLHNGCTVVLLAVVVVVVVLMVQSFYYVLLCTDQFATCTYLHVLGICHSPLPGEVGI